MNLLRCYPFVCPAAVVAVVCVLATASAQDTDSDGIDDALEEQLGLLPKVRQQLVVAATSPNRGDNEEQARVNSPDLLQLEACHVGGQRLLFKVTFARKPVFATSNFILYADLDNDPKTGRVDKYHGGVDVMFAASGESVRADARNPDYGGKTTLNAALVDNVLWIAVDAPLHVVDGAVELGVHLLAQRQGGAGDSTKHTVVRLPHFAGREVPSVKWSSAAGLRPLSDYRYFDDKVKLEKLEDKGLTFEQVAPKEPMKFGRERPGVPFAASKRPGKKGALEREAVTVALLEEAGVARHASPITFGLPLPQGGLFDLSTIRVLAPDGAEVPAQFTATAFWPDDSLKWVLVEFVAPLKKSEACDYIVEFGNAVTRSEGQSRLMIAETDGAVTVATGPIQVVIAKDRFNVFRDVLVDGKRVAAGAAEGVTLIDEHGTAFTSAGCPPRSVTIEQQGPQKVVVRVEGDYATAEGETYMSYLARLTFRAGSPHVEVAWTHVNTYVKTEFTDLESLTMNFEPALGLGRLTSYLRDDSGALQPHERFTETGLATGVFQVDDHSFLTPPENDSREGRFPGVVSLKGGSGQIGIALHQFWQRWPKAIEATDRTFSLSLLPRQPDANFGAGLPHWLFYPFVESKYRLKWGMSFTERITFDFGGQTSAAELDADANSPIVAVLPGSWYAETGAIGPVAAPRGKQFSEWDSYVAKSFAAHMQRKEQYREYGFLNYGDWYGERGRNWGNNEYDLAHGLFMQFVRTADRDYFRWALAAARHQADVDCVHAYPDPHYIGANHQHSIGHTGTWSQNPKRATWSHKYDGHTDARNGHTWADGMVDAWYLAGDARVMEATLGLGEHIAWAMSRTFMQLGTHERSAGWSLAAIMAIYRATNDPVYLEAAKRLVAVPLKEQKFDQGGAWPHILPTDHAGGHPGAVGNNLFLIGVLLGGLKDYHEVTGDPEVEKSLIAGARWVIKSWDEGAEGWPYSASPTGEPYYPARTSLNTLIIEPLAYVGQLTGEEQFIRIAETALSAVVRGGPEAFGKSLAQRLHFTGGTMALLQQWYDTHRDDKGVHVLDGSGAGLENYILKTPDADGFRVRAPDEKVFWAKLTAARGTLTAQRSPHGAKTKQWPTGTLEVFDAAGKSLAKDEYSTDGKHEFHTELTGGEGTVFRVLIRDDQRSVWNVCGDSVVVVAQTTEGFSIGGVGRSKFYIFVPEGTKEFRVKLVGVHGGTYGGALISPDGKLVAHHQDANAGQVQLPWAAKLGAAANAHPERGGIVVQPEAEDTGKVWGLALWAAGDLRCELAGVPPYLGLRPDEWFAPE